MYYFFIYPVNFIFFKYIKNIMQQTAKEKKDKICNRSRDNKGWIHRGNITLWLGKEEAQSLG